MRDRPLWRKQGVRASGWGTATHWVWPTPGPSPGSQSRYGRVTIQAESPGPTTAAGAASQKGAGAKGKMSLKTESAREAGSAFEGGDGSSQQENAMTLSRGDAWKGTGRTRPAAWTWGWGRSRLWGHRRGVPTTSPGRNVFP